MNQAFVHVLSVVASHACTFCCIRIKATPQLLIGTAQLHKTPVSPLIIKKMAAKLSVSGALR